MTLPVTVGRAASGDLVVADLADMPHLLVAGSAGTAMNDWVFGVVAELCGKLASDRLQLLVLNPDGTQPHRYQDCRHLSRPICVSTAEIQAALEWPVAEIKKRFDVLNAAGVRNIEAFNKQASAGRLPYLLIVVDDLAALMRMLPGKTEVMIAMLSALARSTSIHMILATRQPEASVLTDAVLVNCPARVAFKVGSEAASHLVLGAGGAENLNDARELLYRAHMAIKLTPEEVSRSIQQIDDEENRNQLRELLSEADESSPCIPLRMDEGMQ